MRDCYSCAKGTSILSTFLQLLHQLNPPFFGYNRANGYYSPITYFLAKLLFDIIPLRVIPPFILGSIVYGLAGLNAEVSAFWKFIMTLVLFNLTASSIVLFLSVAISDLGVANLLGSLIMLYKCVFGLNSPSFFVITSPLLFVC